MWRDIAELLGPQPPAVAPPGLPPIGNRTAEHLDILRSARDESAFPEIGRAYLQALGDSEREGIYRAVGIDPDPLSGSGPTEALLRLLGPDPVSSVPPPVPDVQPTGPVNEFGDWAPYTPEKQSLHYAAAVSEKSLGRPSANQTKLLTLDSGQQAVFKSKQGENGWLRNGVPAGTYWRREVAASDVADILGFSDLVPPTSFRTHGPQHGSAQQFVPGAQEAQNVMSFEMFDGEQDAARAAVFDYLVANTDRHDGNWMLKNGKLVLIDNGLSFPDGIYEEDFFNHEFWVNAAQRQLPMPDMTPLMGKWPEVEAALKRAGIEPAAIDLTRQRFEVLTSGVYQNIAQLPAFWNGNGGAIFENL